MVNITCTDEEGNYISHLTQWDLNQTISIENTGLSKAPQVHFCNKQSEEAYVVESTLSENGTISAKIPNILLQEHMPIELFIYAITTNDSTGASAKTIFDIKIPVRNRVKPSGYKYVENINLNSNLIDSISEELITKVIQGAATQEDILNYLQ